MGLGYSAGLAVSMYGSGDTAYLVRDFIRHFDLGLGVQSILFERIRLSLIYSTALNLQSKIDVTTGENEQSFSTGKGNWSLLIMNADIMLGESFGLNIRYQADKLRGRDEGIEDTTLKSHLGFGVIFLK